MPSWSSAMRVAFWATAWAVMPANNKKRKQRWEKEIFMVSWCRSFHKHARRAGRWGAHRIQCGPEGQPEVDNRHPCGVCGNAGIQLPIPPNRCMSESGKFTYDSGAVRIRSCPARTDSETRAVERPPSIRSRHSPLRCAGRNTRPPRRQGCPSDTPRNEGSTPLLMSKAFTMSFKNPVPSGGMGNMSASVGTPV